MAKMRRNERSADDDATACERRNDAAPPRKKKKKRKADAPRPPADVAAATKRGRQRELMIPGVVISTPSRVRSVAVGR